MVLGNPFCEHLSSGLEYEADIVAGAVAAAVVINVQVTSEDVLTPTAILAGTSWLSGSAEFTFTDSNA